ncbi:hypothetical protein BH23BAC3_BH23BAC3_31300 [soil metagenome]
MPQQIQSFFPDQPILLNRLGKERFDLIPATPGIYRFYNDRGELLYVGKAKNLRTRLFSYKRAKTGHVSRKVARLIAQTARIEIEETGSEMEALLLENRLIRDERPPFNHANKQTEAYYFVYLKADDTGLEFRLSMRIHEDTDEMFWHGCFKGQNPVRRSMGNMLQLLWMAEHQKRSPLLLPVQLTRRLTPMHYKLPWSASEPSQHTSVIGLLTEWITGASCEFLDWLVVHIESGSRNPLNRFETLFLENRLECLKNFYDRKLVRHRILREKLSPDYKQIAQNELDDLLVRARGIERLL